VTGENCIFCFENPALVIYNTRRRSKRMQQLNEILGGRARPSVHQNHPSKSKIIFHMLCG